MHRDDEILATWDGRGLRAVGGHDRDKIAAYPAGTVFTLKPWEKGSRAARAFVAKFIEVAAENHPDLDMTAGKLKEIIKEAGGFRLGDRVDPDGTVTKLFKSAGKMNLGDLAKYTDWCKHYIAVDLEMDAEAIAKEALDRIKPKGARS